MLLRCAHAEPLRPRGKDGAAKPGLSQLTLNGGDPIFTDDAGATDGLSYAGTYKVVFLAFGFEEYGSAAQKTDFMTRVFTFFGA